MRKNIVTVSMATEQALNEMDARRNLMEKSNRAWGYYEAFEKYEFRWCPDIFNVDVLNTSEKMTRKEKQQLQALLEVVC